MGTDCGLLKHFKEGNYHVCLILSGLHGAEERHRGLGEVDFKPWPA
jgi:hypothetical protein